MSKILKILLIFLFIVTTIYTVYGILQLSKLGGPCNVGLAFIVLIPFLFVCVLLTGTSFYSLITRQTTNFKLSITLSFISLSCWTFLYIIFASDDLLKATLYLGLFEIFNIYSLLVFLRQIRISKRLENITDLKNL